MLDEPGAGGEQKSVSGEWCQVWGGDQVWLDTAHNASTTYNNNTHTAFATNIRPLILNLYGIIMRTLFCPLCCLPWPCKRGLETQRVLKYEA